MATKKSASTAKKSTTKRSTSQSAKAKPTKSVKAPTKATTTTVTSVKSASAATASRKSFSFSPSPLLAASMAEFIGIFLLTALFLVSNGSTIVLLFGLVAIVLTVGAVSGAHINPAVTIAAWVTRRITSIRAISYLVAQVLGAILALVVISGFVNAAPEPEANAQSAYYGQQAAAEVFQLGDITKDKEWLYLAAELIGTAVFAFAIAATTREKNRMAAAFAVGGGFFVALTITGYLTGIVSGAGAQGPAVLNPAVAGALQGITWNVWPMAVYIAAPVLGAVIGFVLRDLLRTESEAVVKA